jgi:hypothetical protein
MVDSFDESRPNTAPAASSVLNSSSDKIEAVAGKAWNSLI